MSLILLAAMEEEDQRRPPRVFRDRQNPIEVMTEEERVQRFRLDKEGIVFICRLLQDDLERPKSFRPKCYYITDIKKHLEKHQMIHKNQKQFKCNECNKGFNRKDYLKTHRLIDSNERQFVCDWSQCLKRFNTKENLNSHKLFVDLKQRKFECNECQKRYYNKIFC